MDGRLDAARLVVVALGAALRARSSTLATAESCTGGLVGALLTEVPGSSAFYVGGVVAYANTLKVLWLGVPPGLLADRGAVSAPVARAMARGARERTRADWALSITGIAGPTGATPSHPVGLVFLGLAGPYGTRCVRRVFSGDREAVRHAAAAAALTLACRAIEAGALRSSPSRS